MTAFQQLILVPYPCSLLHLAVSLVNLHEITNLLLNCGADVHCLDLCHQTPLFSACQNNNLYAAAQLIRRGGHGSTCASPSPHSDLGHPKCTHRGWHPAARYPSEDGPWLHHRLRGVDRQWVLYWGHKSSAKGLVTRMLTPLCPPFQWWMSFNPAHSLKQSRLLVRAIVQKVHGAMKWEDLDTSSSHVPCHQCMCVCCAHQSWQYAVKSSRSMYCKLPTRPAIGWRNLTTIVFKSIYWSIFYL